MFAPECLDTQIVTEKIEKQLVVVDNRLAIQFNVPNSCDLIKEFWLCTKTIPIVNMIEKLTVCMQPNIYSPETSTIYIDNLVKFNRIDEDACVMVQHLRLPLYSLREYWEWYEQAGISPVYFLVFPRVPTDFLVEIDCYYNGSIQPSIKQEKYLVINQVYYVDIADFAEYVEKFKPVCVTTTHPDAIELILWSPESQKLTHCDEYCTRLYLNNMENLNQYIQGLCHPLSGSRYTIASIQLDNGSVITSGELVEILGIRKYEIKHSELILV